MAKYSYKKYIGSAMTERIFVLLAFCVIGYVQADCNQAQTCVGTYSLRFLQNLYVIGQSTANFQAACSVVGSTAKCITGFDCTDPTTSLNFQGQINSYNYLCTSENSQIITENITCLMPSGSTVQPCINAFTKTTSGTSISSTLLCSAAKTYASCVYMALKPTCGQSLASVVATSVIISNEPLYQQLYSCTIDANVAAGGNYSPSTTGHNSANRLIDHVSWSVIFIACLATCILRRQIQ